MTKHIVTTHDERRMLEMAHAGHTLADIADAIGCGKSTVWDRTKGINPRRPGNANPAKGRRMIKAAASLAPDERANLPGRFGYANQASFNSMLCRYRRRVAEADRLIGKE
jgi:hypothetical protein